MHQNSRKKIRIWVEDVFPRMVSGFWSNFRTIMNLVAREIRKRDVFQGSMISRFKLWRRGFLSESAQIYCFKNSHDHEAYLPDYHRYLRTGRINGSYQVILNNKVMFYLVMRSFTSFVTPVYGLIAESKFIPIAADDFSTYKDPLEYLSNVNEAVVLKPLGGGGGSGILFYDFRQGKHLINGAQASDEQLEKSLQIESYIICPLVVQADYSEKIYQLTTNTIRILTMWDYLSGDVFIAAAVHRFGSETSGVVDNWSQGGICAPIDVSVGALGKAASYPQSNGKISWYTEHPDTQELIEGVRIPNWNGIATEILRVAKNMPFAPYIGWDIIATNSGFAIIEGNNRTDVNLMQIHHPLLLDPRVREFYRHHGVIS